MDTGINLSCEKVKNKSGGELYRRRINRRRDVESESQPFKTVSTGGWGLERQHMEEMKAIQSARTNQELEIWT